MPNTISTHLDKLTRILVYLLLFLLPLFFLPITLESLEINKQTLLVVLTLAASLSWIGSMVAKQHFDLRAGWLNIVPLLILGATTASAISSPAPYLSWIGGSSQEYMSVTTIFALTILFFVVVNRLHGENEHRTMHALLLLSATIVGTHGLIQTFSGDLFNTIGTQNALGVYLACMTVFGCGLLVTIRPDHTLLHKNGIGKLETILILIISTETLVLLLILDYGVLWSVLLLGLLPLLGCALLRAKDIHDQRRFILPFGILAISLLYLLWLPTPFSLQLPTEVTPSFSTSATIAQKILNGPKMLFGSGPGTFAFDYAEFKPQDVNITPLWANRFDRGASYIHTIASSLGLIGLLALGIYLLVFFVRGIARVIGAHAYRDWSAVLVDFSAWTVLAISLFLYPANMTTISLLFILSALIAAHLMPKTVDGSFEKHPRVGFGFTTAAIVVSIMVLSVMFVGAGRYLSEIALARAVRLSSDNNSTAQVVSELQTAVRYNRFNDVAERNLSQALLLQVGESLANLTDISTVTAETQQAVKLLSSESIRAAVRATELSDRNALNWLVRGAVYREFIPLIGNAGTFAIAAYSTAIDLEPTNPSTQTELGKTYLTFAETVRDLTGSTDIPTAQTAKTQLDSYLASAEIAFLKAIELKKDFASAHYQLAVTYERQGRLGDSIGKMESIKKYNPLDVGVAFQLGMLYLRRNIDGDLEQARIEFERAVELAPSYSNARWFLASIYEQQGNIASAIEQVTTVLSYNPQNEIVKTRLERLKSGQVSTTSLTPIE